MVVTDANYKSVTETLVTLVLLLSYISGELPFVHIQYGPI